jgi:hypothetical protein
MYLTRGARAKLRKPASVALSVGRQRNKSPFAFFIAEKEEHPPWKKSVF